MGPALVAFLVLLLMAALGVYIVGTGNMYKAEGFDAASRVATLACEKAYGECMKDTKITDKSTCQTKYETCIKSIVNPSVSTATPDASNPKFVASSAGSSGTLGLNRGTYDASGNPTGSTGIVTVGNPSEGPSMNISYNQLAEYARTGKSTGDLDTFIKKTEGRYTNTSDLLSGLSYSTTSKEFNDLLKQVQGRVGGDVIDLLKPSAGQLDLAQGAGALPQTTVTTTSGTVSVPSFGGTKDKPVYLTGEQVLALYTPAVKKIKPHQTPSNELPSMEPEVDDEDDTEYGMIQKGRTVTPSIRQMIRDDVAQIVREEVAGSRIGNPYEVKYDYA